MYKRFLNQEAHFKMTVTVNKQKLGRARIIAITIIFLMIIIAFISSVLLTDIMNVKIDGIETRLTVNIGEGTSEICNTLTDKGVIKHPKAFKLLARIGGYDKNIQPGTIKLKSGMSYNEILKLLVTPNRQTVTVVIPEGFEVRQIVDTLFDNGLIDKDEFYYSMNNDTFDFKFLEGLPSRDNRLEGYLFPATYEFSEGMEERDIINLMLEAFDANFKDEYYTRAKELNMSIDSIITLASIIERETDQDNERAKVAGVFYNRINKGMKLQSCATVQYILGERKPVLSVEDTKIDSPYNTYLNSGFPPGPISNPGTLCIEAALYPEATDALYFVQGPDNKHIFSNTYEEHIEATKNSEAASN